jgi:hypothetical protein
MNNYQPPRLIYKKSMGNRWGNTLVDGEEKMWCYGWVAALICMGGRRGTPVAAGSVASVGEKRGLWPESKAAGAGERWRRWQTEEEEGKWGRRGLKLPSRQRLPRDEGHARFGGQTCFSAGLARSNADAGKNICGPHVDTAPF